MSYIKSIIESHLEHIDELKNKLEDEQNDLRECCRALYFGDVKDMDYDEMKEFMGKIEKYMSSEQKALFKQEMSEKKRIKYPELNRAVYFPEINQLDVSDEEKRRLDRELYKLDKRYLDEDFLKRLGINLSMEDVRKLYELGIIEKYICFIHDGSCVDMISEKEINALKEVWSFYNTNSSELSSEECDRWDELERKYGCDIHLYDENDIDWDGEDWSYDITCLEDYERYEFKSEKYRVCKEPDTKYDNL